MKKWGLDWWGRFVPPDEARHPRLTVRLPFVLAIPLTMLIGLVAFMFGE